MKKLLAALLLSLSLPVCAQQDMGEGSLQVIGGEAPRILPLKHTDVKADISGFVAEVSVTQVFQNPSKDPIEAIYVFPLPENAAVNEMVLTVADRVIRGQIKKRAEAKEIYEKAKSEGKTAALLDQERPNIFTQSVANIPPGKEITVKLRYLQTLKYEKSVYTFFFPMVVGPRYIPGGDAVPDAGRITPPPVKPGNRPGRNISLSVSLDAGIVVKDIRSGSHQVSVKNLGETKAEVVLDPADSIPNKDFILTYEPAGKAVQTAVLAHKSGEDGYLTLMIQPKADFPLSQISPKEMVFAIDVSGSMNGFPVETAKELARHCLDQMNPRDTFQILAFSAGNRLFFDRPLPNTAENVARAKQALAELHGGGGTEMLEAIRTALESPKDPDRLRIVFFMTDGYIGNEAQILSFVKEHLSGSRVFPLGVGSSPNRYLLEELAVMGRGNVQYVRQNERPAKLEKTIEDFYDRIAKPYLTDLEVDWKGLKVLDPTPALIPDLFAGQPVFLHARYREAGNSPIELKGKLAGKPWKMSMDVALPAKAAEHGAMGPLWARAKITELERSMYKGENPDYVQEVTRLALEHKLVTKYTSFVAVDESVSLAKGGKPMTVPVELPIPEGATYEGFYGVPAGAPSFLGGGGAAAVRGMAASEAFTQSADMSYSRKRMPRPSVMPKPEMKAASGMVAKLAEEMLASPSKAAARKLISMQDATGAFVEADGSAVSDAAQALGLLALAKARSLYGEDMAPALNKAWDSLKKKTPGLSCEQALLKLLKGSGRESEVKALLRSLPS